jgi:hypothetical protein
MPNRILKESICYSEDINKLKPDEEIFFYRLIVNCDDYGRMDARPAILKSRLYPLREHMKSDDIKRYLKKLSELKPEPLIILYENNGVQYIQMSKWEKHQQIRAKRSKYPALNDTGTNMISDDINCKQMNAYVPENPNPNPNPNPNKDIGTSPHTQFIPPSLDEVKAYCKERNNKVDADKWHDFYSSKGWMVGKNRMKDWKAAVRTWEREAKENYPSGYKYLSKPQNAGNFNQRQYDDKFYDSLYENK